MRRIHPVLLLMPLFATAVGAWAAGCSTPSSGPPDGGTPGSGGGGDAGDGSDVSDAADHPDVVDAPVEASGEAGWVPVSWKAPCEVQVALHPEYAVPKLTWGPCPGNATGCESALVTWEKGKGPPFGAMVTVPWGDGYRVGAILNHSDSEARSAVFDADGTPIAAWRAPTTCLLIAPRVGPEQVWMGVQHIDNNEYTSSFIVEPYKSISSTSDVAVVTAPAQRFDSNDSTLSLEGLTGTIVTFYDAIGKQTTSTTSIPGLGFTIGHPVNDAAFLLYFPQVEKPEAWVWNRSTHKVEPFIQPAPEFVLDIRSDGNTLVWVQVEPKAVQDPYFSGGSLGDVPAPVELVK